MKKQFRIIEESWANEYGDKEDTKFFIQHCNLLFGLPITNWKNIKSFLLTIPSFIIFMIILVLFFDSIIILKNKYEETNNNLYLFLSFILMILYSYYYYYS